MNYTFRLTLSFIFSFLFFTSLTSQHTISSDAPSLSNVCDGECFTYSVEDGLGGPYFWITTGAIQG